MSTWQGWVGDLIAAAGLATTDENNSFLTQWQKRDGTSCANNPLATYWVIGGRRNCQPLGIRSEYIQKYTSQAQGADAFTQQLYQDPYPHLVKALKAGDPWSVSNDEALGITNELLYWGADKFSNYYGQQTWAKQGGAISAPKAHGGWRSLQNSFNHKMRPSLADAQNQTDAALRHLSKARKVRL